MRVEYLVEAGKLAVREAQYMSEQLAAAQRWLSPRVCPHCGHPPDDFADEETIVE